MFTGIIEEKTTVLEHLPAGIKVARPPSFRKLKIGQSIALNGACLTLTNFDDRSLLFDIVPETFAKTNLAVAKSVNLERALKVGGRFDGHIVQGHVDGTLRLLKRNQEKAGEIFVFEKPPAFAKFFVQKGSITLNGVSLTIAAEEEKTFSVAVIPHTLVLTNLGTLRVNEPVNFECDIMAKLLLKNR